MATATDQGGGGKVIPQAKQSSIVNKGFKVDHDGPEKDISLSPYSVESAQKDTRGERNGLEAGWLMSGLTVIDNPVRPQDVYDQHSAIEGKNSKRMKDGGRLPARVEWLDTSSNSKK